MKQIVALLFALALFGDHVVGWAQAVPPESGANRGSWTTAAVLATLLYAPLKAGLCVIGGGASSLVFLSSGARAARTVAGASCEGTWILSADALQGKEPINFVGNSIRFPGD